MYRAAIFGLERYGIPTHPRPTIYCDGCDATCSPMNEWGRPFAWFLDGKAKKGWAVDHTPGPGKRKDWCPTCKGRK